MFASSQMVTLEMDACQTTSSRLSSVKKICMDLPVQVSSASRRQLRAQAHSSSCQRFTADMLSTRICSPCSSIQMDNPRSKWVATVSKNMLLVQSTGINLHH